MGVKDTRWGVSRQRGPQPEGVRGSLKKEGAMIDPSGGESGRNVYLPSFGGGRIKGAG